MHVDFVQHAIERDALNDARETETVVAVKVRDEDARDRGGVEAEVHHLTLSAFAGIEEQTVIVPTQEVPVVVAGPGGRLARGAEHDQLTIGHRRNP